MLAREKKGKELLLKPKSRSSLFDDEDLRLHIKIRTAWKKLKQNWKKFPQDLRLDFVVEYLGGGSFVTKIFSSIFFS
jgi:hypothetical protein